MATTKDIERCIKLLKNYSPIVVKIPNLKEIILYLDLSNKIILFKILCRFKNQISSLQFLLEHTPEININMPINIYLGHSALQTACRNNWVELASFLINYDANTITVADDTGNTPLMIASINNNINIVEMILNNCKDEDYINKKNFNGTTALMLACQFLKYNICVFLLVSGADKTLVDNNNRTLVDYVNLTFNGDNYKSKREKILKLINP